MLFTCFGQKVALGDLQFLLLRVRRHFDDLHAVKQRAWNGLDRVGGHEEHDAAEVDRNFKIVVAEGAVLLAVEHLQHGAGRVAAEIVAHLVDFVEQEYRVHRASLFHSGDNPPRIAPIYVRRWPRISASSRTPPSDTCTNCRPTALAIARTMDVCPRRAGRRSTESGRAYPA